MCWIAIAETTRPPYEDLLAAAKRNPDGAGIAFRDGNTLHVYRSLDASDIITLAQRVPLPYVIHFRLASAGLKQALSLCHPFAIQASPTTSAEYSAMRILAHNGHWSGWESAMALLQAYGIKFDAEPWSDSRLLASLIARLGLKRMTPIIAQVGRVVVMTPTRLLRFGVWVKYKGYWASGPIAFPRWFEDDLEDRYYRYYRYHHAM